MAASRWIFNLVDKSKTYILFSTNFFPGNLAVYEINVEKYGTAAHTTGGNIIGHQRFTRSINKAINTHSEYVISIAFPLQ